MDKARNDFIRRKYNRLKYYNNLRKEEGFFIAIKEIVYVIINRIFNLNMKFLLLEKPLLDAIILLSQNDFDSNSGAFYNYLLENGFNRKYKIIWLIKNNEPDELPENVSCFNLTKPSIKKTYYLVRSRYIIYDHGFVKKQRSDQISCYLTHGSFGLKAVKGFIIFPDDLDYYLAPSESTAPIQAEQFMQQYPNKKQLIIGFPKHDVFYNNESGDLFKLTDHKYRKVILWMPTFRKGANRNDLNFQRFYDSNTESLIIAINACSMA